MNQGKRLRHSFWRNNTGLEVDLLVDAGGNLCPVEIKSGMTLTSDWFSGLRRWMELAGEHVSVPCLVYGGDVTSTEAGIHVIPWRALAKPGELPEPLR